MWFNIGEGVVREYFIKQCSHNDGFHLLLKVLVALFFMAIALLFLMIFSFAFPAFLDSSHGSVFSWIWQPYENRFGILPMVVGSFALASMALLFSFPSALAIVLYLLVEPKRGMRGFVHKVVSTIIRFMSAIPTVVYGFVAIFLLTPLIRDGLGGSGLSLLTASVMLGFLILPTMVLIMQAGLRPYMEENSLCALALGLSKKRIFWHIILPIGKQSVLTAFILGFGRAIGDTLIPLMLAGNAPQVPVDILSSVRSLTSQMALVTSNEVGAAAYNSLFVCGALLVIIEILISVFLRKIVENKNICKDLKNDNKSRVRALRSVSIIYITCGKFFYIFQYFVSFILVGFIFTLISFLLFKGLGSLNLTLFFGDSNVFDVLFGDGIVWEGLYPACVGTFSLVFLTLCIAILPGIGCGIYLSEYAQGRVKRVLIWCVDVLAGMPSIVMGLFGFSLILFMRKTFFPDAKTGLLLASICLAVLVLPVLISTTKEALSAVSQELRLSCAAIGLSKSQAIVHVLLPSVAKEILGGIMLTLGRAAEDTAVILLTGVVINAGVPSEINAKFEALSFYIYYTAAQYQSIEELNRGHAAALILLFISVGLLLLATFLTKRYHLNFQKR